jgi:ABC-type uncharacterized transport system substrate-binding protein
MGYTPCALAVKQATREIRIVILAGDALGTGLVESPSRPAQTSQAYPRWPRKCVELFRDMLPSARRVAVIAFVEHAHLAGLLAVRLSIRRSASERHTAGAVAL